MQLCLKLGDGKDNRMPELGLGVNAEVLAREVGDHNIPLFWIGTIYPHKMIIFTQIKHSIMVRKNTEIHNNPR